MEEKMTKKEKQLILQDVSTALEMFFEATDTKQAGEMVWRLFQAGLTNAEVREYSGEMRQESASFTKHLQNFIKELGLHYEAQIDVSVPYNPDRLLVKVAEFFELWPNAQGELWDLFFHALGSEEFNEWDNVIVSNFAFEYKQLSDLLESLSLTHCCKDATPPQRP